MGYRLFMLLLLTGLAAPVMAREVGPFPRGSAPAAAEAQAEIHPEERLDSLFEQLHAAGDPMQARVIEQAIVAHWMESGSPTADLLLAGSIDTMQQGDYDRSMELLDALVEVAPDFAEAWNKRATLHYLLGDYDASLADIGATLMLEPRHFGALSGQGMIYELLDQTGQPCPGASQEPLDGGCAARALAAWQRALAANPHIPHARERVRELTVKVRGEPI